MKPLAVSVIAGLLFATPLTAIADDPVVLEPLEAVEAEFDAVAPHDWNARSSGWSVLGVPAGEIPGLLTTPETESEWWDGTVLRLPNKGAAMHRMDRSPSVGDRLLVSANVRLADPAAADGVLMTHVIGRSATVSRTYSARPIGVGGDWRRFFAEIEVRGNWPADGEPYLQLINVGDSEILIDKVSIARLGRDDAAFRRIFNGADLTGWTGNTEGYGVENGAIRTFPDRAGGNLYTSDEFGDFVFRFAFKVPPGANNGIAIRAPLTGDAAYQGMEIQVLDNSHPKYAGLKPWQFHGSVYGISPALRGYQAPPGEWNHEEIHVEGRKIRVVLNGKVITEVDLDEAMKDGTLSGREHPGAARPAGHIGFCGHGDVVHFADLRVRPLP